MRVNLQKLRQQAITELMPVLSAVYFLFDGDELVYIGESRDVFFRVRTHFLDPDKTFDRWTFIEADECERKIAEKKLIRRYKPKYNRAHVNPPKPQIYVRVPRRPDRVVPYSNLRELEDLWFPPATDEEHAKAVDALSDVLRPTEKRCTLNAHVGTDSTE
jgi:excinuclease UvrABC nuclease subunit